jgi:hypothetical protein
MCSWFFLAGVFERQDGKAAKGKSTEEVLAADERGSEKAD